MANRIILGGSGPINGRTIPEDFEILSLLQFDHKIQACQVSMTI